MQPQSNFPRAIAAAVLGAVLAAVWLPAGAQAPSGYAGIGFGRSSIDIDGAAIEQNLLDRAAAEGVAIAASSSGRRTGTPRSRCSSAIASIPTSRSKGR